MNKFFIYKDGWTPSRPWNVDLELDGKIMKSWSYGFKTRKAAIQHCKAVDDSIVRILATPEEYGKPHPMAAQA